MKVIFIKDRMIIFSTLSIFRAILDYTYINFVTVYYSYSGYDLNINNHSYIMSWVLFFIYSFFINANIKKPTDYFFMIAAVFIVAPLTSLYGLADRDITALITTISSFIAMFYIVRFKIPITIKPLNFKNGKRTANYLSWAFIFILIGWYFLSGAFQYFNLNFGKVYDFRDLSAELVNIGPMSYITGWVYSVFSLYAIAYALLKRNFVAVGILILIQIFFFGVSAHKSVFFSPFLVIGVWFYLSRFKTLLAIPVGLTFFVSLIYLIFIKTGDILLPSMFIRRVFFVPAELSFRYFSFFSENQFIYWSNSVLSSFISYPYPVSVSHMIGAYGGSEDTAANNGLVSSGYAHFGYIGVAIYTLIFSMILRFLNHASKNHVPIWFVLAMTITPLRTAITSSDLFTTLSTHGLLIAILLLYLSLENSKRYKI